MQEKRLTREFVEGRANRTLHQYQAYTKQPLALPINVHHICEGLFCLRCDWDVIPEKPGIRILAGIYPHKKLVVLNETHFAAYNEKPGLERFTIGHEVGHWVLHVDHGEAESGTLPGFEADQTILCRDGDDTWIERQANWYSSGLLMPRDLFLTVAGKFDLETQQSHHEMASVFGVTVSALRVRLNQLGLASVDKWGYAVTSSPANYYSLALG